MTESMELLNYIYQNAEMGKDTIDKLLKFSEDETFKKLMLSQKQEYEEVYHEAEKIFYEHQLEPKGLGPMAKIPSYMALNVKAIMDKSTSHLAEMMIQGSTMGITDITKNLNQHVNADIDIIKLAKKLLKTEQTNIDALKKFL